MNYINIFFIIIQCLFSVRTTLKVCKLGERILEGSSSSSGGGGYLNEESILDLGRSLYKLHLQLLLLLEAAAKMYITLSNSATDNKVSSICNVIDVIFHSCTLSCPECRFSHTDIPIYNISFTKKISYVLIMVIQILYFEMTHKSKG